MYLHNQLFDHNKSYTPKPNKTPLGHQKGAWGCGNMTLYNTILLGIK